MNGRDVDNFFLKVFAASVWVNSVFLGTSSSFKETDDKFTFPEGALLPGKDNVITIVQVKIRTPG